MSTIPINENGPTMSRQYIQYKRNRILETAVRAAGERRDINALNDLYRSIGDWGDDSIYASVINAAERCGDMNLVIRAYNRAIQVDKAGVMVYNNLIAAAGNKGRMDLAMDGYYRAVQTGQINDATGENFRVARERNQGPAPVGVHYRHNPYCFLTSWKRVNKVSNHAASNEPGSAAVHR